MEPDYWGLKMRYKIGQHGIGGRDESWYYVEYDAETGEAYWVHEWDNLSYQLQTNSGEKKVELSQAAGKSFYQEAVALMQEKHPEWEPKQAG